MKDLTPNSMDPSYLAEQPNLRDRSRLVELGFVMSVGLITRLLALAVITKQFPPQWIFTRGTEMGFMAVSLLRGDGLGSPFGGHTGPTAMIGPAYPIFVAGIFKIFGAYSSHAAMAIMVIQAAVSLLNLWLILLLAERLWPDDSKAGRVAAVGAGLFWALSPAVFYMPSILWDTTFTACLVSGALVLAVTYSEGPTKRLLLIFCGYCGFAYLINPALLLVSIALVLWASGLGYRRNGINPKWAIVAFLLVCAPWPLRNAVTMRAFIPIRECLGIELNMGNHPGSDGHLEESLFPLFNAAELAEYNQVGEVRYVQHKGRQAEAYIASHPGTFLSLTAQRFLRFWYGTGTRNGSVLFAVDAIPTALLGLIGLGCLWRKHRQVAIPFSILCVLFPLPYYVTHAEFRYRLTLDPLLLPLSAYALLLVKNWVRRRRISYKSTSDTNSSSSIVMGTRSFIAEQNGQTLIVAAASIVVLIACLGMAVDVGHLRYEKRHLQQAADAAALAAGLELNLCGTTHNCSTMQNAAQTAAVENGYTPAANTINCAASSNTGIVLTVNNPSCATGATDSNNGNSNYVEVVMSENVTTYFASILGFNTFPVSVRAEAGRAAAPCIYALDRTPLAVGITVAGLASVNADCPIVDEADAPLTAFNCVLGSVAATKITVGSSFGILSPLACSVTPAPQTYTPLPTPADPLAYLPKPTVPGSCTGSPTLGLTTLQILGTVTLNPGRYCGGITIGPLANVTFNPGVYVLTNTNLLGIPLTGGLTITAGATVNGNGVVFYNDNTASLPNVTGGITFAGNLPLGGLGNISLIAPNSTNTVPSTVNYQGILFYQDSNDTAPAIIAASTAMNTKLEGAFYFPSALVTYAVAGNARFNILVAKDIVFGPVTFGGTAYENSVFGNDYSQLTGGSPIPATAAVLVQ